MADSLPASGTKPLKERITEAACKMLEDGARARQVRFNEIKKNEDMYFGVNTTALRGRSNIPFDSVVMGGFIDTLIAGVRQKHAITYGPTREQDKMAADRVTAVLERESSRDRGNWDDKFTDTKFLAALAGVGFNKLHVEGTPKFKTDLMVCDHYDMVTEALGGSDLDKHLYKHQMNIFRTRAELMAGAGNFYDLARVRSLILAYNNPELVKQPTDIYNNKQARYANFGIDISATGYVGQTVYRLVESVVYFEGVWYYLVFSYETKNYIRCEPLTDVFEIAKDIPGRGPWTAYHTHPHPFLFWTKAPADDVRPIGYTMKKVVNYTIDNLEKRNWQQRAYDPKIFTDPVQLLWKQDGLVRATLKPGQQIAQGIFEFQTPDTTTISINLTQWLDSFLGKKMAVTDEAQGTAGTDKVGIAVQNLQQVSKRLMLANDRIKKSVTDIGVMFDYGCYEYLREPYAVKLIGIKGAQWEEQVTRKDTEREFTVTVRASDEEEQKDLLAAQKREAGFQSIENMAKVRPDIMAKINENEYLRVKFKDMGFDEEAIRVLMDPNNDGDSDSRAHAAQAIQDCLEGKELYQLYRGATDGFIQKILDFCADNFELRTPAQLAKASPGERARYKQEMEKHDKLVAYAEAHVPIAQQNMIRKATSIVASRLGAGVPTATPPATPVAPGTPVPSPMGAPGGNVPVAG